MSSHRTSRRPTLEPIAVLAAAALLVVASACGGTDGGDGPDDSTPTVGDAGDLTITLDGEDGEFTLTSCTTDDTRLTFQGGDGDGRSVIGTLSADGSGGTVTISDQDNAWVAGDAVGEPLTDLEVDEGGASGTGTFTVQEYGEVEDDNRPVQDTGETVDGSFEVSCET